MPSVTRRCSVWSIACLSLSFPLASLRAADGDASLEGMWSDPPATPEDYFCYFYCTDAGIEYLLTLLDDPANDSRPYGVLAEEASSYQLREVIQPHLTELGLAGFPRDPADDPSFTRCVPYSLTRQVFAPHQLEIRRYADRVEMHYGEWEARRTIHLDGRGPPPGPLPLGFSVGRFDGESLTVETSNVAADVAVWRGNHSDQLRVVEVYRRDGDRLLLTATIEDPVMLREPLQLKKVWSWAPDEQIFPYEDCEIPTEFSREGANR